MNGTVGHTAHRKPTHKDVYLHTKPEHYPAQKSANLAILVWQAHVLCDTESIGRSYSNWSKSLNTTGTVTMISDEPYNKTWNQSWKKNPQLQPWCCFIRPSATKSIHYCRNVLSKWFTSQKGKLWRCWGLPKLD